MRTFIKICLVAPFVIMAGLCVGLMGFLIWLAPKSLLSVIPFLAIAWMFQKGVRMDDEDSQLLPTEKGLSE